LCKIRCFYQITFYDVKIGSGLFHFWNQQLESFQKSIGFPRLSLKSPQKWYLGLKWIGWSPWRPEHNLMMPSQTKFKL
jgi:hypothetical protein